MGTSSNFKRDAKKEEFSLFYRLAQGGFLGPLQRKFFSSPSVALHFFHDLQALPSNCQAVLVSLRTREVSEWHDTDLRVLEAAAAEESGQ